MEYRSPKLKEGETSVCLQITEQVHLPTKFSEPTREIPDKMEKTDSIRQADQAPEKKLTLFALRLAILEKAASGLGTLGFIWATVVLLGSFAITLDKKDFWFITIILLIEGTRIFSRSHELEWQHQATWSPTDAGKFSFRALKYSSNFLIRTLKTLFPPFSITQPETNNSQEVTDNTNINISRNQDYQNPATRTWVTQEVPLLPYAVWVFQTKNISKFLYWLQLLSASACMSLSLTRLIQQDYGDVSKGNPDKKNRKSALNIFYALALAEALLFLMEKAYWEWRVSYGKLLHEVNDECEFGNSGLVSIKRFFYDAYSRCVNGSIFDGLKMDLVSFAEELLESNSNDEQLTGVRILRKFATSKQYSHSTLRKIGTSVPVIERLVEMLTWKNTTEEEIRKSAAEILSKLAGKKQNSLRVAGIPGAMESISSLLHTSQSSGSAADEIRQKSIVADHENYELSVFNLLGLLILKKLAHDHDNCGKIGNTRGLLSKIIDFTHADERLLRDNSIAESQITLLKRSLQLVKMLASTSGTTGETLRHRISENVFTISNIREILQYGENYKVLQKLGIEILTSLAVDADAKERIGSTGGILKELLYIFFIQGLPENQDVVRVAGGEALAVLALESERNCKRILRLEAVEKLVRALNNPLLRVNSARILRNLCAYIGDDCYFQLKGVATATPTVLKATMSEEKKLQEIAVGLAAQIFRFMDAHELGIAFDQSGIDETKLATELVLILQKHQYPSTKVPRIRRFVIELAICMMKAKEKNIQIFKDLEMEKELKNVAGTTSELECFVVFSGSVGLSRHRTTVYSLVDTALQLLTYGQDQ
ncbi:uncharacterized protein LOC131230462 [Magnolia sinica]|uniref:uncharacterized protein LOC131230462 n=1 Tax=Magnolia sinica TaxID=86752 RepID=UPI002658A342|nr:uncharacterized protein LOC131230462 [Magnolia sinica]